MLKPVGTMQQIPLTSVNAHALQRRVLRNTRSEPPEEEEIKVYMEYNSENVLENHVILNPMNYNGDSSFNCKN